MGGEGVRPPQLDRLRQPKLRRTLAALIDAFGRGEPLPSPEECRQRKLPYLADDLVWLIRIVGAIAWVRRRSLSEEAADRVRLAPHELPAGEMVDALVELLANMRPSRGADDTVLWLVNRNRELELAVRRSRLAIKADAATKLFNIDTSRLSWAIVDSGIDARHPAFCSAGDGPPLERTRVAKTYDFTRLRALLDPDNLSPGNAELPPSLRRLLARDDARAKKLKTDLKDLKNLLQRGRELDWQVLAPLLEIPHREEDYEAPVDEHGTHVAGILGGSWEEQDLYGICPEIKLYDLRVLGPEGGDEFSVLAALQLIQHLNGQMDYLVIHGANLSLSLRHDVANYACGRTPVCEECERLVASGVVVVAAAGNVGYLKYKIAGNKIVPGYQSTSITDPGNADSVITVGATHRYRPHTYGVSYFSSRGPTGDGRIKPDLVAPGEKVTAPTPGEDYARKDGTSMAAPHVSGAAAILMARYKELVGQPQRIKDVLCTTATDLGRERYFQGAGMLDVLRALQSV
ncbi:MAG: hypothetical protein D6696_06795 [Acidobacteria bacterium]|nr:MAG: hypothetical protein D6696_06795 [Acidobacteriota bacterium]